MNNLINRCLVSVALSCFCVSLPLTATAVSIWNEDTQEDLSNLGSAPTNLGTLQSGTNSLRATFNLSNQDYFTLTIPDGFALNQLVLRSWIPNPVFEDIAFFAVEDGNTFDFVIPPSRDNANGLLGWTHLRSAQVDQDILPEIAASNLDPSVSGFVLPAPWVPGATGFNDFLPAGTYSFWLRQGSDVNITVDLDFNVTSVPESLSVYSTAIAFLLGIIGLKKAQPS